METYPRPDELPSTEELARLAATIYREGSTLTGYPQVAVQMAGNLWLEAYKLRAQLREDLSSDDPTKVWLTVGNSDAYESILHDSIIEQINSEPDNQVLLIGTDDSTSDVLKWLQKADNSKERTLKYRGMITALKKHDIIDDESTSVYVYELRHFLKRRADERAQSAAARRRARTKKKVSVRRNGKN